MDEFDSLSQGSIFSDMQFGNSPKAQTSRGIPFVGQMSRAIQASGATAAHQTKFRMRAENGTSETPIAVSTY